MSCSSNSCIFGHAGQGTNSGCTCLKALSTGAIIEIEKRLARLRLLDAMLADAMPEQNKDACKWTITDTHESEGLYDTGCNEMFECNVGNRKENQIIYCPYCGGLIEEA